MTNPQLIVTQLCSFPALWAFQRFSTFEVFVLVFTACNYNVWFTLFSVAVVFSARCWVGGAKQSNSGLRQPSGVGEDLYQNLSTITWLKVKANVDGCVKNINQYTLDICTRLSSFPQKLVVLKDQLYSTYTQEWWLRLLQWLPNSYTRHMDTSVLHRWR